MGGHRQRRRGRRGGGGVAAVMRGARAWAILVLSRGRQRKAWCRRIERRCNRWQVPAMTAIDGPRLALISAGGKDRLLVAGVSFLSRWQGSRILTGRMLFDRIFDVRCCRIVQAI